MTDTPVMTLKRCTKCGGTRFNAWRSCMDCRNARGRVGLRRTVGNIPQPNGKLSLQQAQAAQNARGPG